MKESKTSHIKTSKKYKFGSQSKTFNIVWEGSQFVYHSLALVNRELCLQLIEVGCQISVIPYENDQFGPEVDKRFQKLADRVHVQLKGDIDVCIRHQWPPDLTPPVKGHWVLIQPWELGSLPKEWVEVFSKQVDEIWVPSTYVKKIYLDSGIPVNRVFVIPNGINPYKFHPDVKPYKLRTKKKFKFLFLGGTIFRKGIDLLLKAYLSSFNETDDVCLVIKDLGGESFYKGQTFKEKIKKIMRKKDSPAIEYINRVLPEDELNGLYTACDTSVFPYRGEGFGLPILEGMACGLPTIVTNGGSCLDFCSSENSLLVEARKLQFFEKKIDNLETVDYPWIYEVNIEDLKKRMLYAFNNPDKMKILGAGASKYVHNHFTWSHSSKLLQDRIANLRKLPVRRFTKDSESNDFLSPQKIDLDSTLSDRHIVSLFNEANTLIKAGKNVEAIKMLLKILEIDPKHFDTLQLLGESFLKMGRKNAAQQIFEAALTEKPHNLYLRNKLQEILNE